MAGRQPERLLVDDLEAPNVDPAGDAEDIGAWMARRAEDVFRQGPDADAAGREAWAQATRLGQNLVAAQPSDVTTIGARALNGRATPIAADDAPRELSGATPPSSPLTIEPPIKRVDPPDLSTPSVTIPDVRFATARPGDSISRLLGTSDPGAIGRFLSQNGFSGRSSTLQPGRSYVIPRLFDEASPEERAVGSSLLRTDDARLDTLRARRADAQARSDQFAELFNQGFNPWTGTYVGLPSAGTADSSSLSDGSAPTQTIPRVSDWLDKSGVAKELGGSMAQMAGNVFGLSTGAWHAVKGLGEGAYFTSRLFNPVEAALMPPEKTAWGQVFGGLGRLADYAVDGLHNPSAVGHDIGEAIHKLEVDTDPNFSPVADTFGGEAARRFNIGKKQSELGIDLGTTLVAGGAAKGLTGLGALSKEAAMAKYLDRGLAPAVADYLSDPYPAEGMGHHFFGRAQTLPTSIGGIPLPASMAGRRLPEEISESPFNVLRPRNITRGEFYELHYKADRSFHGAKLPRRFGQGWSGRRMGLTKDNDTLFSHLWYGSPAPLKAAVAAPVGAGELFYDALDGEQPQ